MAQQRVFMGTVLAIIPDGGDENHPIFIREGKVYPIDKLAEADVASRLGNETVGGPNTPIYIKDGVPTPMEGGIGTGSTGEVALGDGSIVTIEQFIEDNIDIIREKLGIVTREHDGLVPKLPTLEDSEG